MHDHMKNQEWAEEEAWLEDDEVVEGGFCLQCGHRNAIDQYCCTCCELIRISKEDIQITSCGVVSV